MLLSAPGQTDRLSQQPCGGEGPYSDVTASSTHVHPFRLRFHYERTWGQTYCAKCKVRAKNGVERLGAFRK